MNNQNLQPYFLLFLLTGTFLLSFLIFRPFVYVLIMAAVFAVVFRPLHQKIINLTGGRQSLSAFITVFTVVILIVAPATFLGVQVFQEAQHLYAFLLEGDKKAP